MNAGASMGGAIDRRMAEALQRAAAEATTELEEVRSRLSGIRDDRGAVVLAHLFLARCVDNIIAAVLPRFGARLPGQDTSWRETTLTDYHRLQLARTVTTDEFTPVLNAVDVLRKVRNEFAHKADLDTLEDLPSRFGDLMREAIPPLPSGKPFASNATMSQLFSELLFATLIELHVACAQLRHQIPTLGAVKDVLEEIRDRHSKRQWPKT